MTTKQDDAVTQGRRGYFCRMPFSYGLGLTWEQAVVNASANVSADLLSSPHPSCIDVFEGPIDGFEISDWGTVRGDDIKPYCDDETDEQMLASTIHAMLDDIGKLAKCLRAVGLRDGASNPAIVRLAETVEMRVGDIAGKLADGPIDY